MAGHAGRDRSWRSGGRSDSAWRRGRGRPRRARPAAGAAAPCSPWRGRSPAGWQFTQRGWVSTLPSSVNSAAERAAVIGDRGEALRRGQLVRLAVGDRVRGQDAHQQRRDRKPPPMRIPDFISVVSWLIRRSVGAATSMIGLGHEIAVRIGEDHVAHRLVIFDVAGAAAEMAVERLGDRLVEVGPRHRRLAPAAPAAPGPRSGSPACNSRTGRRNAR